MDPLLIQIVKIVVIFLIVFTCAAYYTLMERQWAGYFQRRLGPNRFGPGGVLQPLADGLKFICKEDFVPGRAYRWRFILAPMALTRTEPRATAGEQTELLYGEPVYLLDRDLGHRDARALGQVLGEFGCQIGNACVHDRRPFDGSQGLNISQQAHGAPLERVGRAQQAQLALLKS